MSQRLQAVSFSVKVSRGGSRGASVEPPKLNVKTYNKRVAKKTPLRQILDPPRVS